MIRGVIFDVDGVLLDSMRIWDTAATRYLTQHGIAAQPDLNEVMFAMTLEEGGQFLKQAYALPYSPTEIIAGVLDTVRVFYENEVQLKSGVLSLLTELQKHDIPITAATTSDRTYIEAAFCRLHIASFFPSILTCSEIGVGKQEPLIFYRCCEQMATVPADTLVFEDSLYAAKTAKSAGFFTAGIYDSSSSKQQHELRTICDFYFLTMEQALSQLLPLLQKEGFLK